MNETLTAFMVVDEDGNEQLGIMEHDELVVPMVAQDPARADTLRRFARHKIREMGVHIRVNTYELRESEDLWLPDLRLVPELAN